MQLVKINNIDIKQAFGISVTKIKGAFDMPGRYGTYEMDWQDVDGIDAFTKIDDLYYKQRIIQLECYMEAGNINDLQYNLGLFREQVYKEFTVETPYSTHNCLLTENSKVRFINDKHGDGAKIDFTLSCNEINYSFGETIEPNNSITNDLFWIDKIDLRRFGIIVEESEGFLDFTTMKDDKITRYMRESDKVNKRKTRDISLKCSLCADNIDDFKTKMYQFHALLSKPGLRNLMVPLEGIEKPYEVYCPEGFKVSELYQSDNSVVGRFTIIFREVEPQPESFYLIILLDTKGIPILTTEGHYIYIIADRKEQENKNVYLFTPDESQPDTYLYTMEEHYGQYIDIEGTAYINPGVKQVETLTIEGNIYFADHAQVETQTLEGVAYLYSTLSLWFSFTNNGTVIRDYWAIGAPIGTTSDQIAEIARNNIRDRYGEYFTVDGSGSVIRVTRKIAPFANDVNLNISVTNEIGFNGIVDKFISEDTLPGMSSEDTEGVIIATFTSALMNNGNPFDIHISGILANYNPSQIATKIRDALYAYAAEFYSVEGTGADMIITARGEAANDESLNLAVRNYSTLGMVDKTSSENTVQGEAIEHGGVKLTIESNLLDSTYVREIPLENGDIDLSITWKIMAHLRNSGIINSKFMFWNQYTRIYMVSLDIQDNNEADFSLNIGYDNYGGCQNLISKDHSELINSYDPDAKEVYLFTKEELST